MFCRLRPRPPSRAHSAPTPAPNKDIVQERDEEFLYSSKLAEGPIPLDTNVSWLFSLAASSPITAARRLPAGSAGGAAVLAAAGGGAVTNSFVGAALLGPRLL